MDNPEWKVDALGNVKPLTASAAFDWLDVSGGSSLGKQIKLKLTRRAICTLS